MPELGSTYRSNLPPQHIWIIISDPRLHNREFVFVNLTTLRDRCVDDACVLTSEDYPPFLTHETTVAYSRHSIGNVAGIEELLSKGVLVEMPAVPTKTLAKIITGARQSPELSRRAKSMLPSPA